MTCPTCGNKLTAHSGVHKHETDKRKALVKEANFFSCSACGEIFNVCKQHGKYSAEWALAMCGAGNVCPGCCVENKRYSYITETQKEYLKGGD